MAVRIDGDRRIVHAREKLVREIADFHTLFLQPRDGVFQLRVVVPAGLRRPCLWTSRSAPNRPVATWGKAPVNDVRPHNGGNDSPAHSSGPFRSARSRGFRYKIAAPLACLQRTAHGTDPGDFEWTRQQDPADIEFGSALIKRVRPRVHLNPGSPRDTHLFGFAHVGEFRGLHKLLFVHVFRLG